jgi:hypothetical protein
MVYLGWKNSTEPLEIVVKRSRSEDQFQPKLNLARTRGCGRDFARRGTDRAAGKDVRVRKTEIGSVGDIKKFGPK